MMNEVDGIRQEDCSKRLGDAARYVSSGMFNFTHSHTPTDKHKKPQKLNLTKPK